MKLRSAILLLVIVFTATLALGACGGSNGGAESTVTGQVTKVDTAAKTFTISASGKTYDFKMVSGSKGDMNEINEHMALKKDITVKYKGSAAPYEVINAD